MDEQQGMERTYPSLSSFLRRRQPCSLHSTYSCSILSLRNHPMLGDLASPSCRVDGAERWQCFSSEILHPHHIVAPQIYQELLSQHRPSV